MRYFIICVQLCYPAAMSSRATSSNSIRTQAATWPLWRIETVRGSHYTTVQRVASLLLTWRSGAGVERVSATDPLTRSQQKLTHATTSLHIILSHAIILLPHDIIALSCYRDLNTKSLTHLFEI